YGINFDVALFTNLTQEHLDFHKNLDDYVETKFKLFLYLEDSSGVAFINVDDAYGDKLYKNLKCEKYSLSFEAADFVIQNCKYHIDRSLFELMYKNEILKVNTNLIGRHNVFNISSAIAIIKRIVPDIPSDSILKSIKNIFPTKGRLENVSINKKISIFVDYAHTPDALKNVLKSLSKFKKGRLICVFGAGGERDKRKRPKMLDVALDFADLSIITNDNPRYEEPADIIRDIVGNTEIDAPYWITRDREIAIQTAINLAKEDDIVLIAGKGHETYQEIKGKKLHFNDKEVAQSTLIAKKLKDDELSIPIDPLQLEFIFEQKLDIASEDVLQFISMDSRTIQDNS
ncbi:MAG: UDP-N-acetylmuramoyl-L-alanyl-D-glutamate--2,6-diaminopimelate ligase, partial [Candidatus Cloacimonetes bacterium]|nr:UDP-N-acetylmuramoyl-L-alanyl-D-glutamate--2,6-diaminopimelate ligase [Candidatus Cloacimonadota bacterium]